MIQQVSHLRLVVAVPEEDVGGMARGAKVEFQVPAYPERTYSGTVARIAHALDQKTRTMPVELDVLNRDGSLSPGMYPAVKWPVRRARPALFVPKTSVVTTTERVFVIREPGWPRGMGGCKQRRRRRRSGRGDRESAAGRPSGPPRNGRNQRRRHVKE